MIFTTWKYGLSVLSFLIISGSVLKCFLQCQFSDLLGDRTVWHKESNRMCPKLVNFFCFFLHKFPLLVVELVGVLDRAWLWTARFPGSFALLHCLCSLGSPACLPGLSTVFLLRKPTHEPVTFTSRLPRPAALLSFYLYLQYPFFLEYFLMIWVNPPWTWSVVQTACSLKTFWSLSSQR